MAAPVDADRVTYDGSSVVSTHNVTLPGSISSGDILIMLLRTPTNRTFSLPAGWEQLAYSSADADDDAEAVYFKLATGSEGATAAVVLNGTSRLSALTYRITGGANGSISAVAIGTTGQPDSPSLTLAITKDVLWLSLGGGSNQLTLTSGPSGYSNPTVFYHTGGGATGGTTATVWGASKQATGVTTEDPGAWTLGGTLAATMSFTVAIYTGGMPLRVSQEVVETLVLPTDLKARVSQEVVEALILPTDAKARVSQEVVEAVVLPTDVKTRVSQMVVEVLIRNLHEDIYMAIID